MVCISCTKVTLLVLLRWKLLILTAHPSWVGKNKPQFVARFKYRKPYKTWINFLVKSGVSVEDYMYWSGKTSPLDAMIKFGFKGKAVGIMFTNSTDAYQTH